MMRHTVRYTHKGWFGLCPAYFADLDGEAPDVHPRHWCFEWLMDVSEFLFWLCSPRETGFVFYVTGELDPPKVIHHEIDA